MDITKALIKLRPGATWTVDGNTYEGITWLDTQQNKPTKLEIEQELQAQLTEFHATEYQRLRMTAYPSIVDQLDLLYHGGYDAWQSAIQAIKNKYPKG